MTHVRFAAGLAIVAAAFAAGTVNADVVASFTYDSMSGSYDGAGNFQARAVDNAFQQTSGDTSRLDPVTQNATFAPGFVSRSGANAIINISVNNFGWNGPNTALGGGSFTLTDVDGTTCTGSLSGDWSSPGAGILFFNGAITGATFSGASWDGEFGSWATNLPGGPPYDGAIVQLTFSGSGFFDTSFSDRETGSTLQLVPAPGALALLGLGGLAAARRRR